MQIVFHTQHPLLDVPMAGRSPRERMVNAFAPYQPQWLSQAELADDGSLLWIEGVFPLLDQGQIDRFFALASKYPACVLSDPDYPGWGLLYLSRAQDHELTQPFADIARSAVQLDVASSGLGLEGLRDGIAFARLQARVMANKAETLARTGVVFHALDQVFIDDQVTAEAGVVIGPNVTLSGKTHLAGGCRVEQGAWLRDVQVAAKAVIKPYCVIEQAHIGEAAAVGPFAHIRPGSNLGPETKVGNFVETKKVVLGAGSKASHLAYLGDAEIGRDCNIGAGTITCNYDGIQKHQTRLGDRVFIGSDSQLVAPVRLGDDSFVAAGSTVTMDVPTEALAISRSRQINKEGYAEILRQRAQKKKS